MSGDSGEKKAIRMLAEVDPGVVIPPPVRDAAWWRGLLVKYMATVMEAEGISFIDNASWAEEEKVLLLAIEDEADPWRPKE